MDELEAGRLDLVLRELSFHCLKRRVRMFSMPETDASLHLCEQQSIILTAAENLETIHRRLRKAPRRTADTLRLL